MALLNRVCAVVRLNLGRRGLARISSCRTNYCSAQVKFNGWQPRLSVYGGALRPGVSCAIHHSASCNQAEVVQFNLSDIGEGIREVVIKEWLVNVGDTVVQFDSICEVQSDKASVTITSRYDGIVRRLYYDVDDTALVGEPLVDIELSETGAVDKEVSEEAKEEDYTQELTLGSTESPVAEMRRELAMADAKREAKAAAGQARPITKRHVPAKDRTKEGSELVGKGKVLAAPVVRRLAMEHKINLNDVRPSGSQGQVTKEDVLRYIAQSKEPEVFKPAIPVLKPAPVPTPAHPPTPVPSVVVREDTTVPIRGMRKAMVKTMTASLQVPLFAFCDECDVSAAVNMKSELSQMMTQRGVKFTYMPLFIKGAHNVGVAFDSPEGLVVPVVKNVQQLSLQAIAMELQRLGELSSQGKLGQDDLAGATFSLSNIGSIGGTYAQPILLPGTVCIGALGRIQRQPRFDEDGDLKAAHVMALSWSADHRVIEGAVLARFSNLFRSYLEQPSSMLLDMR